MNDDTHVGLVAVASSVLALVGFVVAELLEVFAPCRVVYRMASTVQGSLACQTYAAIVLLSLLLLLAGAVLGVVVVARGLWRRKKRPANLD